MDQNLIEQGQLYIGLGRSANHVHKCQNNGILEQNNKFHTKRNFNPYLPIKV